jgi:hypothetical protein
MQDIALNKDDETVGFGKYLVLAREAAGSARGAAELYDRDHKAPGAAGLTGAVDILERFLCHPCGDNFDEVVGKAAAVKVAYFDALLKNSRGSGSWSSARSPAGEAEEFEARAVLGALEMARIPFAREGMTVVRIRKSVLANDADFVRLMAEKAAAKAEEASLAAARR